MTAAGCVAPVVPVGPAGFELLDNPAAAGGAFPFVAAAGNGSTRLGWVEQRDDSAAVMTAALVDGTWSSPATVVEGDDLFVNWADFPSVAVASNGTLLAHWLQRSGEGRYAYDVMISRSTDEGATWSPGQVLHNDGIAGEHGFVSLVPDAAGAFIAVWLDGRLSVGDDARMTLRTARIGADGEISGRQELDDRICDCCQTGAARVGNSVVAAYRDRAHDEVRDVYAVRLDVDGWHDPTPVGSDGWMIPGCPVNGPSVAGRDGIGAVAWFSLVDQAPEVKVVFTDDEGTTFGAPILIERGTAAEATLGRVELEWVAPDRALVFWMTQVGDRGEIRFRTVDRQGTTGPVGLLATTGAARSSGFPRAAVTGTQILVAWTDTGTQGGVRTATAPLSMFEH